MRKKIRDSGEPAAGRKGTGKTRQMQSRCARLRQRHETVLTFALGRTGIVVQIEAELGQRLEREGQKDAVFLYAAVIADDGA